MPLPSRRRAFAAASLPPPAPAAPTARTPQISASMSVGRASLLLGLMVALSRITGFGRVMLTSALYGLSSKTDAYNAAFNIPDTLTILIAGGALATGFVPVFTGLLERGQPESAVRTFRAMWTLLLAAFGVITLALFALTFSRLGLLLAPRRLSAQDAQLYLHLLRILLASTFFYVLGGLFAGTLNAMRHFWYFALQPVAFNGGIILFGILGPRLFHAGIESQAWGALCGSVTGSILIQVPGIYRHGLTLKPLWDVRDEGVRQVLRGLLPIAFGLASGQLIAMQLPKFFAFAAAVGDLTALDNANRLMTVPVAVLASGPAIALFPTLVQHAANKRTLEMREAIASALRGALVLNLLASALLIALAHPLIRLVLQHGSFTAQNARAVTPVLVCYALGLVALSAQQFLSRGFYALNDTRTPTLIGAASMLFFLVTAWATLRLGHATGGSIAPALAACSSLAIGVLSVWMASALSRKLGGWDNGRTAQVLAKGGASAVAAGVAAFGVASLVRWPLLGFLGGAVAGTFVFIFAASVLELPEASAVTVKLARLGSKLARK